jgi:mono/diheme cytochrome c family protein
MLRAFFIFFVVAVAAVLALAGFRGEKFTQPPIQIVPDMKHQPKVITQHPSRFFVDGRGDHAPIPGTIPVGYELSKRYLQSGANSRSYDSGFTSQPDYRNTGVFGEVYGDGIGEKVDEALMSRGRERYEIYCAVCHGRTGEGNGVAKSFGLMTVASLQDDRIKAQPDGQIYATIVNGKGTMGAYGPSLSVSDRWAIVAYVRALHKSQSVKAAELDAETQAKLNAK